MAVLEDLSEDESYLFAILEDQSGIDLAEFSWFDPSIDDGCWRAWPFQWPWWRCPDTHQVDLAARAVGKSLSVTARLFAFPFRKPGQEAVITAPELIHLEPIIDLVEERFYATRLGREMLPKGRGAVTHRPFMLNTKVGARIIGRIPQRDGRGVKGLHPIQLEQDECFPVGTLVLTRRGQVPIERVEIGDEVFTHKGRWRLVENVFRRQRPTVIVRGHGHPGLRCSESHPFWAMQVVGRAKRRSGFQGRIFGPPRFVAAKLLRPAKSEGNLDVGANYWSSPVEFPASKMPAGPAGVTVNDDFWWLLGLFVAEGHIGTRNTIAGPKNTQLTFSVALHEVDEVQARLRSIGLQSSVYRVKTGAANVSPISCGSYRDWMALHVGRSTVDKQIPAWLLGLPEAARREALAGYVWGDGNQHADPSYAPGRWQATTVSQAIAVSVKLLAQTLGYSVTWYRHHRTTPAVIDGREVGGDGWYQLLGSTKSRSIDKDGQRFSKVRTVEATGETEWLYDLTVEEDHSFIADGLVVRNSQDYPEPGWTELTSTLKQGFEGVQWRAHGVTKGVHGKFYEYTTAGSGWTVHRITALHRPNMTDEERQNTIAKFGGHRDDPDFRRNFYGEHGDQTSLLFVLSRLMKCVDDDRSSAYNTLEYKHLEISDVLIEQYRRDHPGDGSILELLTIPEHHRDHAVVWCGMDVGLTADPTEILVWAETHLTKEERREMQNRKKACPKEGESRLKLILRLSLKRVTNLDQITFILGVIGFYKPQAFALDRTGIGLPLYQDLQEMFRRTEELAKEVRDPEDRRRLQEKADELRAAAKIIKGYNFSEKVIVDIDEQVKVDEDDGDLVRDAGMARNVLEHSTDLCRKYVDTERFWLPWDRTLISEYEGQTVSYSKAAVDQFGRRRRTLSKGKFHAFDATRMLAMAHGQQTIEAIVNRPDEEEPVLVIFGDQF